MKGYNFQNIHSAKSTVSLVLKDSLSSCPISSAKHGCAAGENKPLHLNMKQEIDSVKLCPCPRRENENTFAKQLEEDFWGDSILKIQSQITKHPPSYYSKSYLEHEGKEVTVPDYKKRIKVVTIIGAILNLAIITIALLLLITGIYEYLTWLFILGIFAGLIGCWQYSLYHKSFRVDISQSWRVCLLVSLIINTLTFLLYFLYLLTLLLSMWGINII